PTPTSSEDAERAAIKRAILDFKETLNRVRKDPQADINALKSVAGGQLLDLELSTMKEWRAKGWRQVGDVRVEHLDIGPVSTSNGKASARATYCADSSGVDAVDSSGKSIVVEGRPDHFPTVMTLERSKDGEWIPMRESTEGDACADEP